MGFSVSGATAIILIALLVSAATLVPAVQDAANAQRTGVEARDDRMLNQQNTQIEVTEAVYDSESTELTVRVENTGTTTLDADMTDLLVDGSYTTADTAVDGDAGRTLWTPGSELRFEHTATSQPDRIVVVTEHDIRAATAVEAGAG